MSDPENDPYVNPNTKQTQHALMVIAAAARKERVTVTLKDDNGEPVCRIVASWDAQDMAQIVQLDVFKGDPDHHASAPTPAPGK